MQFLVFMKITMKYAALSTKLLGIVSDNNYSIVRLASKGPKEKEKENPIFTEINEI